MKWRKKIAKINSIERIIPKNRSRAQESIGNIFKKMGFISWFINIWCSDDEHSSRAIPLLMLFILHERNGWRAGYLAIWKFSNYHRRRVIRARLAVFDDRSSVPRIRETSFEDHGADARRCMKMSVYSFSHDSANQIFANTRLIFKFLLTTNDARLWIYWKFKLILLT